MVKKLNLVVLSQLVGFFNNLIIYSDLIYALLVAHV